MTRARHQLGVLTVLVVTSVGAQDNGPKMQTQKTLRPMVVPVAGQYVYTAKTAQPTRKTGVVKAAGIDWTCEESSCTTRGPWAVPGVEACAALARQVGRVESYGHPTRSLGKSQLATCNRSAAADATVQPTTARKPGKVTAPVATSAGQAAQPDQDARTATPATVSSDTKLPLPQQSQRLPRPGTPGGQAPPPGAADEIRGFAASRATIDGLGAHDTSCVGPGAVLEVLGRNFGDAQGGRQVVLATSVRNTPVATLQVRSWSNTRVQVLAPSADATPPGRPYAVGIQSGRAWTSNLRPVRVCPAGFSISGNVSVSNCAAGAANVMVDVLVDGSARPLSVRGSAVPGNDFAVRYEIAVPAAAAVNARVTPRLEGIACPGGAWSPADASVSLSYSRGTVRQDFAFSVPEDVFRINMGVLARLLAGRLGGTQIHINSYDPASHGHRANDSYFRLPADFGGEERRFNIPELASDPFYYYVNAIDLGRISGAQAGREIRLIFSFETDGPELVGKCERNVLCALAGNIEAAITVDVFLTLERYVLPGSSPSLSFGAVRVVATPNARLTGLCDGPLDGLCNEITHYNQRIKDQIESNFSAVLDTRQVRDQVAAALRPQLDGLRIGSINSVEVVGAELVIHYLRDR